MVHALAAQVQALQIQPPDDISTAAGGFEAEHALEETPSGAVVFWPWGPADEAHPIPDGWQEYEDGRGKTLAGLLADDEDFGVVGNVGGVAHTHADHPVHYHNLIGPQEGVVGVAAAGGDIGQRTSGGFASISPEGDETQPHESAKHIQPTRVGCWIQKI